MSNPVVGLAVSAVVSPLRARHHAQIVAGGFLACRQNGAYAGRIHSHRLLNEAVFFGLNRGIEV